MILITFPHYTSGGLLCDMIDDTMSVTGSNGGLQNYSHNLLKVGKFDSIVQNSIDLAVFEEKFNDHRAKAKEKKEREFAKRRKQREHGINNFKGFV